RSGLWALGHSLRRRQPASPLPQHLPDLLRQRPGAERLSPPRRPGSETLAMGLGPSRNRTPAGMLSLSSTPGAAGMWAVFLLVMLLAASRETPAITVPRLLFGLPLARGQRLIAGAMLANRSDVAYRRVHVRLVLGYVPGGRPWPLYRTYPWAIDVQYPLGRPPTGSKAFDLLPGRTERFWEGSPAIPGTILGLGGHMHDYGVSLELKDMTA